MSPSFGPLAGLRYGLLGLPLAFVALPLYVLLPNHYAREFGVPLATLGAVLLGARLLDALIDPLLGRLSDRLHARSPRAVLGCGAVAAGVLLVGFGLLFFPQALVDPSNHVALLVAAAVLLALTYAGYSMLSIAHQSWGAMLGGDALQRGRIVGWREGLGLVGVVLASVIPTLAGLPAMVTLFGALRRPAFRRLLVVFVLNGIASAVPATLVLFFVQDRLRAPASLEPAFLGLYFVMAAASIPAWLRIVRRFGLARSWLGGMCMSVAVFAWAGAMGAGDAVPFLVVCALSGFAIGSDLVLPSALLAGIIAEAGDQPHAGAYFGWWNFATKLNLALAAGLALPLLGLAGYVPGAREPGALRALSLAYCLLPCVLKVLAGASLWALVIRPAAAASQPVPVPKAAP